VARLATTLFQWRAAEELARPAPLIVEDSINVTALAKLAMERPPDETLRSRYLSSMLPEAWWEPSLSAKLIMRSTAIEVQLRKASSPLNRIAWQPKYRRLEF